MSNQVVNVKFKNMSEIILLNDTVNNSVLGDSRYMGAYTLASQLESAGFKVTVIDYFTRHPDFFTFIDKFITPRTLFIGISSTFLAKSPSMIKLSDPEYGKILVDAVLSKNGNNREDLHENYNNPGLWFKTPEELLLWTKKLKNLLHQKNPLGHIILGGAKTSLLVEQKAIDEFDYIVIGTADRAIVELARHLKANTTPAFSKLGNKKILNNLQDSNNKQCPETLYHSKFAIQKKESLPIEISRGCLYNCNFCHYEKKESYRKDLSVLKNEFIRNYENFGTTVYQFCDDCFNDSLKKVEETCNMIMGLPFKIEWISYARVDLAVSRPETLAAMIESGAKGLFFGIESLNDEAIKNSGKKVRSEKLKQFLLETYQQYSDRCLFEGSFIVGLPGETKESIEKTIQWLTENRALDFVSAARLYLQPYEARLDKVSVDYSEYSRSPDLYGIIKSEEKINNQEWTQTNMNSTEASELTRVFLEKWSDSGKNTILRNIFDYPVLRSSGFSQQQIWDMARNEKNAASWGEQALARFQKFVWNYWKELEEKNA